MLFHTFGDHPQPQTLRQRHNGAGDGRIVRVDQDVAHKGLVDFQLVQRQPLEVGQRRETGAEIVQREPHATIADLVHLGDCIFDAVEQHALGQLQFESLRIGATAVQAAQHQIDKLRRVELACADVHRQAQVGRGRVLRPQQQLCAGRLQHPLADAPDQAGFLGQRNELARGDDAALRMDPAQQAFGASDLALQIDLGLEIQLELLLLHGLTQLGLECGAFGHRRLHGRIEKAQRVAPGALGLVHGQVGLLEQVVNARLPFGEQCHADAGAAIVRLPRQLVRLVQRAQQFFSNLLGAHDGLGQDLTQIAQQHHEFVTAQACHRVAVAHALAQPLGHFLQQQVAHVMAQRVVQRLEVVQIDKQQGATAVVARKRRHLSLQPVAQQAPVRQSGQRVVKGEVANFIFGRLAQCDVGQAAHVVRDFAMVTSDGGDAEPFGIDLTGLAAVPHFTLPRTLGVDAVPHGGVEGCVMPARLQE